MYQYFFYSIIILFCISITHAMETNTDAKAEGKMSLKEFKEIRKEKREEWHKYLKSRKAISSSEDMPEIIYDSYETIHRIGQQRLTPTAKLADINNSRHEQEFGLPKSPEIKVQ